MALTGSDLDTCIIKCNSCNNILLKEVTTAITTHTDTDATACEFGKVLAKFSPEDLATPEALQVIKIHDLSHSFISNSLSNATTSGSSPKRILSSIITELKAALVVWKKAIVS